MGAEPPKGPKTVTTVQRYDADGALVSETVTTVTVTQDAAQPWPGCYP